MRNTHRTTRFAAAGVAGVAAAATLGLAGTASATTSARTRYVQTANGQDQPAGQAGSTSGPTNAQTRYVQLPDGRYVAVGQGGNQAPATNGVHCAPRPHPGPHGHPCPGPHGLPRWMHGAPAVPKSSAAKPAPKPAAHAAAVTHAAVTHAAITAKPSVKSVQAWHQFHVTGTTSGIAPGSTITLQQKQHGRFVPLPASMHTNHHGAYQLRVELGIKGLNDLRIVSGHVASPVFTVFVR
ncbi:hypothetical protein [Kitasatospora sp. NBC_01302]|uniref:hypothetical protein n=1 Tax=Kitasatospora sp. NBC_01302 TaxID=2903575 RepID=UPI002E137D2A|nr:hypothetical protein OG294_02185 [Kitasatospora sp. NBC_01302]